jgi:hypothetical protein
MKYALRRTLNDTNLRLTTVCGRVGIGAHAGWCAVGMSGRAGALRWVRQLMEHIVVNNCVCAISILVNVYYNAHFIAKSDGKCL